MKILSLYDGMACGMLAFLKAGIPVEKYYAYEIDKYAIQTTQHNFPDIEQCGDVFDADFTQYKDIDFIIGGSPCTYWSIAQSPDKRETTASGLGWELFSQYAKVIDVVKPKYFIYENNKSMSKSIKESISETFGFEPICINSALVSAQNRQRLYWVGKKNDDGTYSKVNVEQPEDRGILLKDILEGNDLTCNDKSYALTASYNGAVPWNTIERSQRNMVCEPANITDDGKSQTIKAQYNKNSVANFVGYTSTYGASGVAEPIACRCRGRKDSDGNGYAKYECRDDGKANTLDTNTVNGAMVAIPVNATTDGKSQCLRATCYKDGIRNMVANEVDRKTCVAEHVYGAAQRGRYNENGETEQRFEIREDNKANCLTTVTKDSMVVQSIRVGLYPTSDGRMLNSQGMRIYSIEGKSVTQSAQGGGMGAKTGLYAIPVEFKDDIPIKAVSCVDGKTYTVYEVKNGEITIKEKKYPIKLADGYYIIRKLTVTECKRLQTVPEWYEFPVSDTQAYKCLGNGWTIDVIVHLIQSALNG